MVTIAAADSLLGQLQRGRGSGFRRALIEDKATVSADLLTCLLHDPRWDRQVESRSDYYAQLVLHAHLALDPLEAHLRTLEQTDPDNPNDLVLNTLCALAVRGHERAASILRDYQALQNRATAADLDRLLDAAQNGERWQRVVAFRSLQHLAHPGALPVLRACVEVPDMPVIVRRAAWRAFAALPPALTLDLARAWFDAPASPAHLRYVARRLLEEHASREDVPRLRTALAAALQVNQGEGIDYYLICTILGILARFPEAGPYPEADVAFTEVAYSWTRRYAAAVLAASESERFAHGRALECLWDCEDNVRLIGCRAIDMAVPDALERLHAIRRDPYEDDDVRAAARDRLGRRTQPRKA